MRRALREVASESDATFLQRFFRTGPGEYGEGDKFLGVRVPATRKLVRQFTDATLPDILVLLQSEWHEERLLALLLMVRRYQRGSDTERRAVYRGYLTNMRYVNNWDLVDSSAEHIVGAHLASSPRAEALLMKLTRSKLLWERRIAMLSAFYFIKRNEFGLATMIAAQLLHDKEDLIHKASGWMLREAGNRDRKVIDVFLAAHLHEMPRTMLRYAIEKLPEPQRLKYLKARP
ncbi:MAG: DNA alkylation repair protein [Phycisphaerae bacterium]|nr:DNA alkylation repair protein [Gemmatimonadaceae bacterium]